MQMASCCKLHALHPLHMKLNMFQLLCASKACPAHCLSGWADSVVELCSVLLSPGAIPLFIITSYVQARKDAVCRQLNAEATTAAASLATSVPHAQLEAHQLQPIPLPDKLPALLGELTAIVTTQKHLAIMQVCSLHSCWWLYPPTSQRHSHGGQGMSC